MLRLREDRIADLEKEIEQKEELMKELSAGSDVQFHGNLLERQGALEAQLAANRKDRETSREVLFEFSLLVDKTEETMLTAKWALQQQRGTTFDPDEKRLASMRTHSLGSLYDNLQ